jgi:transposase
VVTKDHPIVDQPGAAMNPWITGRIIEQMQQETRCRAEQEREARRSIGTRFFRSIRDRS